MRLIQATNDKLPFEQPFQEALRLYRNRLAAFLAIVLGNLALLGVLTSPTALEIAKPLVLAVILGPALFALFTLFYHIWSYIRYGMLLQGFGGDPIHLLLFALMLLAFFIAIVALGLLILVLGYGLLSLLLQLRLG